ncbi:low specificity L-threonine aldolase [Lachnospiraceae bacterium 62-26]
MIRFESDYLEGAHPLILKKLEETNFEQTAGYGTDPFCAGARERIKEACEGADVEVHFLVGGTQTNLTVISSILRPHQGVLAAVTGHVNVHETGAIEAVGHKVLALASEDGKITADQVRQAYEAHWNDGSHEHIVQPGMVYISQPTENGTLYGKAELEAMHDVCQELGLTLFLDGARMGYGLMAETNDLTLGDIAGLVDVFYIGGTKVGALFGEAVVICNPAWKKDFRYLIKQKGGMLAKGRLLGIQFDTLFTDGLYYEISRHADELAMRLREAFLKKGYKLRYDSYTNQQFPVMPDAHIDRLKEKYSFEFWEKADDSHSAVRFCTSWATKAEAVDELIHDIELL